MVSSLLRIVFVAFVLSSPRILAADTVKKPNIVFILADDLSWHDLRVYGNKWHDTPNLDRLASQGMRFTHAYASAPICSASRVALLTGRSPARLHFEFVTKEPGTQVETRPMTVPEYPLNLPLQEVTIGEMLGQAGYRTGYYGKWHVSQHTGGYLGWSTTHGPLQQGFTEGDSEFGSHPYSERPPEASKGAKKAKAEKVQRPSYPQGEYGTDALTDKAIDFIKRRKAEPFFMVLSHYYVHTPVRSRAQWLVDKYRQRLPQEAGEGRAAFGAMVETLDHLVGRVLKALDDQGVADNTIVIFTSDNGGHPEYSANGPSRGSKWNVYEGGIRVPLIVRWPGKVQAGSFSMAPVIGTDLFPTLAAVTGTAIDTKIPRDGVDVSPLWLGKATDVTRTQPMVWHFPYYHPETGYDSARDSIGVDDFAVSKTLPQTAIRSGGYKLVRFHEDGREELYHLARDPSEKNDLSKTEPKRRQEIAAQLDAYLKSVSARLPAPRAK